MVIRYPIDGKLQVKPFNLPAGVASAVVSRMKILSQLDIAEKRVPRDGKVRVRYKGGQIGIRTSTFPSCPGSTDRPGDGCRRRRSAGPGSPWPGAPCWRQARSGWKPRWHRRFVRVATCRVPTHHTNTTEISPPEGHRPARPGPAANRLAETTPTSAPRNEDHPTSGLLTHLRS
ncbi:MAG: hypothetical protein GXP47_12435 [Acidobacteria bacterium]|nr:hypothetical protein [Acidobacteriota bacterium]